MEEVSVLSTSALLLPLPSGCWVHWTESHQDELITCFRCVGNSLLHCVPAKSHKGRHSVPSLVSSFGKKHPASEFPLPPHYVFEPCSVITPCIASDLSSEVPTDTDSSAVFVYTAERDSSPRARFFLQSLIMPHQIEQGYIRSRIWIRIFICHLAHIWRSYK